MKRCSHVMRPYAALVCLVALVGSTTSCRRPFFDLNSPGQAHLQVPGQSELHPADKPFFHITSVEKKDGKIILRVKFINENRSFITGAGALDWEVNFGDLKCKTSSSVTEVREAESSPLQVLAVADYSGSMADHVSTLNWSLYGLSTQLRPDDKLALIAFDHTTVQVRGFMGDPLESDDLDPLFGRLGGGTFMYTAVEHGLASFPAAWQHRRIVVLFSDGGDTDRSRSLADAHTIADRARQQHIPIFTIGIGDAEEKALSSLATHSGGSYYHVGRFYDLSAFLLDVIRVNQDFYQVAVDYNCDNKEPAAVTVQASRKKEGLTFADTKDLPQPVPPPATPPPVQPPPDPAPDPTPAPEVPAPWVSLLVKFDLDKSVIRPESYGDIDEVAKAIKRKVEAREIGQIIVEGHTDADGPAYYNQALSVRRAQAVIRYLINKGLDAQLFEARGHGETEPAASNDTREGKASNRRVELSIKGTVGGD